MKTFSTPTNEPDGTSAMSPPHASSSDPSRPSPAPNRPPRLPIDRRLVERGEAARKALDDVCPDAAPDERILNELVARQLPVALLLHDLEEQLAARMMVVMDDPRLAVAVARVLHDTATMASAMSKRIQSTLSTAASLRAQRRFLALHGRVPESKGDV